MTLLDSRGQALRVKETLGDPQRVAIFCPGLNYSLVAPLFFYLEAALSQTGRRVAYIAKSIGTSMLLNQVRAGLVAAEAELVWLTPGTTAAEQFEVLRGLPNRSLVAYRTADKHILKAAATRPQGLPRVTVVEVADAGHVFEVEGNVRRSITNVADVIDAVSVFLAEGH